MLSFLSAMQATEDELIEAKAIAATMTLEEVRAVSLQILATLIDRAGSLLTRYFEIDAVHGGNAEAS
jgi:hypothetical protein